MQLTSRATGEHESRLAIGAGVAATGDASFCNNALTYMRHGTNPFSGLTAVTIADALDLQRVANAI